MRQPDRTELQDELYDIRDKLLESIKGFFTVKIWTQDTASIKDFTKYINRYFSSDLHLLLEEHLNEDLQTLCKKLEYTMKPPEGEKET